ncbi:MAG: TonB-dependent receptor, partial [Pseudomonadota bacterium]
MTISLARISLHRSDRSVRGCAPQRKHPVSADPNSTTGRMRRLRTTTAISVVVLGLVPSIGLADDARFIEVPGQPLAAALTELSRETGRAVLARSDLVQGKRSKPIRGVLAPADALRTMVAEAGLAVEELPDESFVLTIPTQVQSTQDAVELEPLVLQGRQGGGVPGASGGGGTFDIFEEERTIETIDEEEIERANIESINDALDSTANVVVVGEITPNTLNVTVRGISDVGNVNSTAPTTGVFVDGVLRNQSGTAVGTNSALIDVERVDVFLGPQTTTFSRGTTAGAVNVVTKKPTDELEFTVEGDIGAFETNGNPFGGVTLIGNTPLLDDGLLSARLVLFSNASKGFIEVFDDDVFDDIETEQFGGRLSLRSQPTNDLTLDFQLGYSRSEFDDSFLVSLDLLEEGKFVSFEDPLSEDTNEDVTIRIGAQYETAIGTFSSNSSFRFNENNANSDGDGLAAIDVTEADVVLTTRSFSQEFRYDGAPLQFGGIPGDIVINAGASFTFNDFETSDTVNFGSDINDLVLAAVSADPTLLALIDIPAGIAPADIPAFIAALPPEAFGFLDTEDTQEIISVNVYGDLAWSPIPQLELSGGLRYSFDRIETSDETVSTGPLSAAGFLDAPFFEEGDATFNSVTPRASISYDWTDDITTFFSFSVGFRPGGISETPFEIFEFDEEITRSFEVGLRSRFFD